MRVCHALSEFVPPAGGAVVTIGNFDGMHRGHAALLGAARRHAEQAGAGLVVLTFEPHPLAVLAPERAPARLTTPAEKLMLLERVGVTATIVLASEPALFALEAEDFLASLVTHTRPRAIVEGPDFRFGRGRRGSLETLRQHAAAWGYEVLTVPTLRATDLPTDPTIGSTSIRQALRDGRLDEANRMLGRPYRVTGVVGVGHGRGATIGYPTANLERSPHLLPQDAVYAAAAQLADGRLHLAAVNVGPQPTFGQGAARVEAFLLDFAGDLRGQRLGLHFLARLRPQRRFADVAALVAQIDADVAAVRSYAPRLAELQGGLLPM